VVVDLNDDRPIGEINDTPGLHGFALAPSRGFSSNGRENKLSLVDPKTLRTISKVVTGENPDPILYEPQRAEVYAFNGRRESATIIEPKSATVSATIALGGKPEFTVADAQSGRVFCNIEDKNELIAIDTKTHSVIAHCPSPRGRTEWRSLRFQASPALRWMQQQVARHARQHQP